MRRTEILALVAGAIVGVWGGMLGAFLVATGSWEVWLSRFLTRTPARGEPAAPSFRRRKDLTHGYFL